MDILTTEIKLSNVRDCEMKFIPLNCISEEHKWTSGEIVKYISFKRYIFIV